MFVLGARTSGLASGCALLGLFTLTGVTAEENVTRLPEVIVEERSDRGAETYEPASTAITTITSNQFDEAGIASVREAAVRAPNLQINHSAVRSFGDVYTLRGLHNTQLFSDPAVVMYVDDAPFGNVFSYSTELYDVERLEVLRGPQGTVFGKNSEAGVIHITTRRPGDRFEAEGAASYGSYDAQYYRAAVTGPILTNRLYFGFAGIFEKRDGFLHNTNLKTEPDSIEGLSGRSFLEWKPASDWNIRFAMTGQDFDDGAQRLVPLGGGHFKNASDFAGVTDTQSNGQSLRVEHRAPGFTFLSVTSRLDWQLDPFKLDLDLSPFVGNTALIRQEQEQWTQELRVQSPPEAETWKWRAGFFLSTTETEGDSTRNFFVFPPGFFANERTRFTMDDDTYALFGSVTARVGDKLDLTLGTRLEWTHKEIDRSKSSTIVAVGPTHRDEDFFNVAPKAGLEYHLTDAVTLYGSSGLGFRPGGFSAFIDPPASPEYDTELVWANELGAKTGWLERKLSVNAALFYNRVWDYQVERTVAGTTDLAIFTAPEVHTMGAEVELIARPVTGLELSGAFGYTHAEFVRYQDPTTGVDLAGNDTPYTPEFTATAAAQYKHRLGFFGRVEFVAIGETFYDEANTGRFRQASYGLLNARLGYERKHFAVFLFGRNLTDTEYFVNKVVDLVAGVPGEPATIGAMVQLIY